jgi:hypothetical protein
MACEDNWAKNFCFERCQKSGAKADLGGPVNYYPRACAVNLNKRKPSVVIGRSYMDCLPHEICHIEGKNKKECAIKYPCSNDLP